MSVQQPIAKIYKDLLLRILVILPTMALITCSTPDVQDASRRKDTQRDAFSRFNKVSMSPFIRLGDSLLPRGFDSNFFYEMLGHELTSFQERLVKVNVTGYLKPADYSHHHNKYSVDMCSRFRREHATILERAQQRYNVPAEVIVSILWVETKFGKILGNNHVASTLLSIALANQEENRQLNRAVLVDNYRGSPDSLGYFEQKLFARSQKKTSWALTELMALDSMRATLPGSVLEIKGSSAGAFGLPQFLPSSYLRWGTDGNGDGKVDLFTLDDAVFSVANYLRSNGWGDKKEQKEKAVFHYNNLKAYVDAVLTLAASIS